MAEEETLRPNAAGDECNINVAVGCSVCPNHYDCVYEVVADGATTMLVTISETFERDLYNIGAPSGSGTINKITVHAVAKCDEAAHDWLKIAIQSDSTPAEGTAKTLTTSFVDYSEEWALNPADGEAWEWDDIVSLQIGAAIRGASPSTYTLLTQVYVVVNYTLAVAGAHDSKHLVILDLI